MHLWRLTHSVICSAVVSLFATATVGAREPGPSSAPVPLATAPASVDDYDAVWCRLARLRIDREMHKAQLNDPPSLYIIAKVDGKEVNRSDTLKGWDITFPVNVPLNNNEFPLYKSKPVTIEIWSSKTLRDKKVVFTELADPSSYFPNHCTGTATATLEPVPGVHLELAFAGRMVWYRLKTVDIPAGSQHRVHRDEPPDMYIVLKKNGVRVGDCSTYQRSWSIVYPVLVGKNRWEVREGTDDRYTVEVWDDFTVGGYVRLKRDSLLFSVADVSGEDFRLPLREKLGSYADKESVSTITFQRPKQE